jgi:hypothetical protein
MDHIKEFASPFPHRVKQLVSLSDIWLCPIVFSGQGTLHFEINVLRLIIYYCQ